MMQLAWIVGASAAYIVGLSLLLHLFPRLGSPGRALSAWLCRAPGLDGLVSLLTWLPPTAMGVLYGWRGLVGTILGQCVGLVVWCWGHELANMEHVRGPRIVKFINRTFGRVNNHVALWATVLSVPAFVLIRATQIVVYPQLTFLIGLPKYNTGEWVNVSRQKFAGLVGHDRIWCLYCDWMTGAYSLGAEMLRNLESFWCPIKFASGKKCENCKMDFPDIEGGWVRADGTMSEVVAKLEEMYGAEATAKLPKGQKSPWFGHPVRLTVEGKRPAAGISASARAR